MATTDLIVTNFNPNFTGVSATAAAVVKLHQDVMDMRLAGVNLPGCHPAISKKCALKFAKRGPASMPFQIWHVRRNTEMTTALYVRDILRLPIKIVFTSAAQRRHSWWPRVLISRMDAVIATTESAASYANNVWATVPHGVDTEKFHPASDRYAAWRKFGFPGTKGIACIGRIRPEKGTDRFVDVAIKILSDYPEATALIIGRAKREHQAFLLQLKEKIAAAGMQARILFLGEISPEKLPELLRALTALIALPRYEGYGMTPLEAMASGVPVLASDTGYFREFLDNGRVGNVFDTINTDTISNAALSLISDNERHGQIATLSVKRAKKVYDVQAEANAIAAVYERLWEDRVG